MFSWIICFSTKASLAKSRVDHIFIYSSQSLVRAAPITQFRKLIRILLFDKYKAFASNVSGDFTVHNSQSGMDLP